MSERELDALVAERVMGLPVLGMTWCSPWHDSSGWYVETDGGDPHRELRAVYPLRDCSCLTEPDTGRYERVFGHDWTCLEVVPPYSSEMAHAWEVVERMKELGYAFAVLDVPLHSSVQPAPWVAFREGVHPPRPGDLDAAIACEKPVTLAICLAALRAVGTEKG